MKMNEHTVGQYALIDCLMFDLLLFDLIFLNLTLMIHFLTHWFFIGQFYGEFSFAIVKYYRSCSVRIIGGKEIIVVIDESKRKYNLPYTFIEIGRAHV